MTVGIVHTNGKEAVVIVDKQGSNATRRSDSYNKLKTFEYNLQNKESNDSEKIKTTYSGIFFGAGDGNYLESIISDIQSLEKKVGDNLLIELPNTSKSHYKKSIGEFDLFLKYLHQRKRERVVDSDNTHIQSRKEDILSKALLEDDEKIRREYIQNQTNMLRDSIDRNKYDRAMQGIFSIYDKEIEKIRLFHMDMFGYDEYFGHRAEIGSGADGANAYLSSTLQGVVSSNLLLEDLLFFCLNAYSMSDINHGVGGTPRIAILSEKKSKILDDERTILLANLSGIYLAEKYERELDSDLFTKMIEVILSDDYHRVEELLPSELKNGFSLLKDTHIPFSSWQESASRKAFGKQSLLK